MCSVIPGKAPEGYLVKVDKITRTDSRTTFETTRAGLSDAFNDLSFDYSLESVSLSPENFTVYDPFTQENLMPYDDPLTRGISTDLDFAKDKYALEGDEFKLEVKADKATLEIVVLDMDEDYETKNDQTRLEFTIEYDLKSGEFKFNKGGEGGFINAGMDVALGGFVGLKFGKEDKKVGEKSVISTMGVEEMNEYQTKVEKKLMGKKIRVASCEIPVDLIPGVGTVLAALIKPRFDLYFVYNVKMEGAFRIGFVWEKAGFEFHTGNSGDDFSATNEKKTWFNVDKGDVHFDVIADCDLKGSIGAGIGLVVGAAKMVDWLADGDEKPYVGAFFEFTGNLELGFKSDFNFMDQDMEGYLEGKAYFKTEGFLEGSAKMMKPINLLWHAKIDIPRLTYKIPDPPLQLRIPFLIESDQPIPHCVSPENRAIIQDAQVDLSWAIPFHLHAGTSDQGLFDGITYTVYAGTDKVLVEQSSPQVRVATGLRKGETHFTMTVDPLKTYYWKVICTNQFGFDYTTQVWSFDTGYDGEIALNEPLKRFLSDYRENLPGVRIEEDGTIYRTPSNIAALEQITTLVLQDPNHKYGIESIDELLVFLPSLETLNCKHNSIRSLNLTNNKKLKGIACEDNYISSIDLSGAPNLTGLNCSGNKDLKSLDLSKCPQLVSIECSKCNIEELDLRYNQYLQGLFASENHLAFLDISRCPNLLRLDVYSQSVELLTLRLTHAQMDRFALFKRHFNMDFEYVDVSGIQTDEAVDITGSTAKVEVTVLETGSYSALGIVYSHVTSEPTISSEYTESIMYANKMHYTFQLKDLKPETLYYARGVARDAESGLFKYGNIIYFRTGKGDPAPKILIKPDVLEFGEVTIGRSMAKTLEIQNVGDADLTYRIVNPEDSPFSAYPTDKTTLQPGESQTVNVYFSPTEEGEVMGDFTVLSNDQKGDQGFAAWGTGIVEDIPVTDVVFVPDEVIMGRGDDFRISIKVLPENATKAYLIYNSFENISDEYEWTITDDSVVHLDSWGKYLYAVGAGSATVTAKIPYWSVDSEFHGYTTYFYPTCHITVLVYIDKLFIVEGNEEGWNYRPCPKEMIVGESQALKVKYYPEDATETDLIWKSDDPSVASVSAEGRLTALKKGKTTIRCMVATEVRGHIEVSWELDVKDPNGSHEGFGNDYWD